MIKKILKIQNVGRLRKLHWGKGRGDAGKVVGIFAGNGSGKTTLVAAFRSVQDGSPDALLERQSLPKSGMPSIDLLTERGLLAFADGAWTGTLEKLEIFDRTFVAKNVYDGREVGTDQRQGLYRIALGSGEVSAAKRVEAIKAEKKDADAALKAVRIRVEARCTEVGVTVAELKAIEPLAAPPAGLPEMEGRLGALKARPDLTKLPAFSPMQPAPALNVSGLRALMNETAVTLSAAAAEAVRHHIAVHLDANGETWIRQGVHYAQRSTDCPYCGQDLAGSAFAGLFPTFFDEGYRNLQQRVEKSMDRVPIWDQWSATLANAHRSNQAAQGEWTKIADVPPPPDGQMLVSAATRLVTELRALVLDKKAHLLDAMGGDQRIDTISKCHGDLVAPFQTYVDWFLAAQALRHGLIGDHSGGVRRLEAEIAAIRARLLAGSPSMILELEELARAATEASKHNEALRLAQEDLSKRESTRTDDFVAGVNKVLTEFGTGFRLGGLKGKSSSTRMTADFTIVLAENGQLLKETGIAASSRATRGPRFDTVLSEGDRVTLALAVFFAKCKTSPDPERIAILDDPFTSLDTGRRRVTSDYVNELTTCCAQVWLFSHDEYFLKDSLPPSSTWLALTEGPAGMGFVDWDPEAACRTSYARDLDALRDFVARVPGGLGPEDAWRRARPVLEGYLRFRFPRAWAKNEWLGHFVTKGKAGNPAIPLPASDIERIGTWCRFSNPGMHANPLGGERSPTEAEIRTMIQAIVAFVQA